MTITESPSRVTVEPRSSDLAVRGRDADRDQLPPAVDESRARWRRRPSRSAVITAGIGLLALALYTWNLSAGGYANGYYAAAVKSASVSWKALFFGSIDPGNFITVDKPPAALWLMGMSARLFGFSSLSMLLPEALCGVGSVLLLHKLVRRWAGDAAAHLSALALALTPVAALMFRFNNPDALLTFLGIASAWFLWKAVETGRTRSLLASAALVGLAFDTKMLQAVLLVPAFILVYLVAGPPKLAKRFLQLLAAAATLVVAAGWWVAIVALWPASARPYIGSTTDNSIISLITGYNGLGRLFGNSAGNGGGGGGGGSGNTGFGGTPGWLRTFNQALGGQISWLIPMAAAGLAAGLWLTRRAPRTDRTRAGWLLFGGWAAVCALTFSLAKGTFHPYYTVQLAPAVAALAGAGGLALWRLGRTHRFLRWTLPATVVATAAWSVSLLGRTPGFVAWLPGVIGVGAAVSAVGIWAAGRLRHRGLLLVAAGVATATLLAGPTAYTLTTIAHPATGSLVSAGPSSGGGFGGNMGGVSTADTGLVSYLEQHQGSAKYLVAAFGSQSSSSIIIASGKPVVTIGGFNGSDNAPTLAQFEKLVSSGQLRYVLVSSGGGFGGAGGPGGGSSELTTWITAHGTAVSSSAYGGTTSGTLYRLTSTT
ncbi:MAG: glycosyltransferase family 39 protein [Actinomycetota bacterium]|nr:glycosyltransferase family 39 protein [Actinomycetota bacterium]